ncbi:MAG: hypothetical protein E7261_02170 [Lachnospiraceae bacterium]|nr:hypothetical protein [Lachnospiraceae bacterium]
MVLILRHCNCRIRIYALIVALNLCKRNHIKLRLYDSRRKTNKIYDKSKCQCHH